MPSVSTSGTHTLNQTLCRKALRGLRGLYVTIKGHKWHFLDLIPVLLQMKSLQKFSKEPRHNQDTFNLLFDFSQVLKLSHPLSFLRSCHVLQFCQGRDGLNILESSISVLLGITWQEMITALLWAFLFCDSLSYFYYHLTKNSQSYFRIKLRIITPCSGWVDFFLAAPPPCIFDL